MLTDLINQEGYYALDPLHYVAVTVTAVNVDNGLIYILANDLCSHFRTLETWQRGKWVKPTALLAAPPKYERSMLAPIIVVYE